MKKQKRYSIVLAIVCIITMCFGNHAFAVEKTTTYIQNPIGNGENRISFTKYTVSTKEIKSTPVLPSSAFKGGTTYKGDILTDDFYLYRNMLSGTQKTAYNMIKNGLLSVSDKIWIATSRYSAIAIKEEQIKTILAYVIFDNPELFWCDLNFKIALYSNGNVAYVVPGYNGLETNIDEFQKEIDTQLERVFEVMDTFSTDIDKVKFSHDYLIHTIDYVLDSKYNQSIYSALVNRQSVCAGYAHAFQYMMQKMEIPCAYVSGTASGGSHAWNIVLIDGEYYAMDVTWDDPVLRNEAGEEYYDSNFYRYAYFNVTDAYMEKNQHIRSEYSTELPTAMGTKYSYANYYNNNAYGTDFSNIEIELITTTEAVTGIDSTIEESKTTAEILTTMTRVTTAVVPGTSNSETSTEQITTVPSDTSNLHISTDSTTMPILDTSESDICNKTTDFNVNEEITGTSQSKRIVTATKPVKTSVKKVSVKKRKLIIRWRRAKKYVSGYQIQYSANKKFKNKKTRTVKGIHKLSIKTRRLKKAKKYCVRIRTYIWINKRRVYSEWSKIKIKKIK